MMKPFCVYALKPEVLMKSEEDVEVFVRMRVSELNENMCTIYPDISDMNIHFYISVECFNSNYDKVDYLASNN